MRYRVHTSPKFHPEDLVLSCTTDRRLIFTVVLLRRLTRSAKVHCSHSWLWFTGRTAFLSSEFVPLRFPVLTIVFAGLRGSTFDTIHYNGDTGPFNPLVR